LESLLLDADDMAKPFFDHLALSLPAAANLRDLRQIMTSFISFSFKP